MKYFIFTLFLMSCTDPDKAKRVLEQDGFTDIELCGYSWFACGDDFFKTCFKAKKSNKEISGTVCSGFLKDATIRFK